MKTSISKTLVLTVAALGLSSLASAETVHAAIPFEFKVNGTTMPAGTYTVRTMSGSSPILLFENDATKAKALAFARVAPTASKDALAIKMATATYEVSKESSSLKGALLSVTK